MRDLVSPERRSHRFSRPRYVQIADELAPSIDNRQKHDRRLRSIRDLAKQCDISLVTIRQALDGPRPEGTIAAVAGSGALVQHGASADTTATSAEWAVITEQFVGVP